jgi:hypothetical protein
MNIQAKIVQAEVRPTYLPWSPLALITSIALVGWMLSGFTSVTFKAEAVTAQGVAGLLGALFVISAFIERFLEVFVFAWRGFGGEEINHEIEVSEGIINDPNATADERIEAEAARAANLETKWRYVMRTRSLSFLAAVLLGEAVALLGVRALEPLVELGALTGKQLELFRTFDIVLTAGLIGGGTDGLHKLTSTITTYLDVTKKNVKGRGS